MLFSKTYHLMDFDEYMAMAIYTREHAYIVMPHANLTHEQWQVIHFGTESPDVPHIPDPKCRVLAVMTFESDTGEFHFHDKARTKIDLPHPVYEGNQLLAPEHVEELHHLWCHEHDTVEARKAAASKSTVHDVIRRAAKIYIPFKLSRWT